MTLVRYDSSLVARPYLARGWHWSDGGRTLTFALRTDVRWHDGRGTTARDVVWTLDAARDPATGYPRHADLVSLTTVTAPNDSTVVGGELDFAGISPQRVEFVRGHTALAVRDSPLIFPYGLVFNTRRPPFDDPQVRRAAALAIDRQEIVDGYLFGFASAAAGPVPPGLPGSVTEPVALSAPDSARRILAARSEERRV